MKIDARQLSKIIREAVEPENVELSREDVLIADKVSTSMIQIVATLKNASDPRLHEIRAQLVAIGKQLWSLY